MNTEIFIFFTLAMMGGAGFMGWIIGWVKGLSMCLVQP